MDVLEEVKRVPELNFILLCACAEPSEIRQDRIKWAANLSLNWDLIYEISLNHRILPLLYKNIKEIIPDKVPPQVYEKLKDHSFQNATRNLYLLGVLLKILNLFKAHDIDAIPFKGPVLAQDIYGDIGLRVFSDLDLLVSKRQAVKVWKLLRDNGFCPELELNKDQIIQYIDVEDNISFFKIDIGLNVELHWEMSGIYLSKPLMLEHIKERLDNVLIDKRVILNLASEDLLLYLCIHGAKHKWEHLEMVCCISELLKTKKDLDWKLIEQFAHKWKCKNMLGLGLYLSRALLDAPVPESVYAKIAAKKNMMLLGQEVLKDMFKEHFHSEVVSNPSRFSNFHIKIKDSFFDKIQYSLRLTFRPTKKEWIFYPVPAQLSFLHFFVRPYRLLMAILRKSNA